MKNLLTTLQHFAVGVVGFLLFPAFTFASIQITEIMYAPEEGVAYEWFEIYNSGGSAVDLSDWKFSDGSNHVFEEPPKNGGQGSLIIQSGSYAVVAKEADMFLSLHSSFSGTVIDASFTLTDTGKTLSIINNEGSSVDSVSYTENSGAQKNGLSFQKAGSSWQASTPTPGTGTQPSPSTSSNNTQEQDTTSDTDNSSQTNNSSTNNSSQTNNSNTNTSSSNPSSPPKKERLEDALYLEVSGDSVVIAGADTHFKAVTKDERDRNPRSDIRWNFGDGIVDDGEEVTHVFLDPGTYTVVVHAKDKGLESIIEKVVEVVPTNISIEKAEGSKVRIANNTRINIDLSGWILRSRSGVYEIPDMSRLQSQSEATFITGLKNISDVSLHFPSGRLATYLKKESTYVAPASVRRSTTVKKASDVTPEEESVEAKATSSEGRVLGESESREIPKTDSDSPLYLWLLALLGVMLLGAAGVYALRKSRPEDEDIHNDTFSFIDEEFDEFE